MFRSMTMAAIGIAAAIAAGCDGKGDGHGQAPGETHGTAATPAAPAADGHSGHAHGDAHGSAPAEAAPTSLADAATRLEAAHKELGAIVKDGDLAKAHPIADRIRKLAAPLPELATKAGLPAADVKEVNLASKELQGLFDEMDKAGDSGNRAASQAALAKYEKPIATVRAKAGAGK